MATRKRRKAITDDCTMPPPIEVASLPDLVFGRPTHEEAQVRDYMARECKGETLRHLERVGSEALLGRVMGLWDVRTSRGKWWVITNPTNLYSQKLFPSLDYTISFHVGLMTRVQARQRDYEGNARVMRILPTVKKLEAASMALDAADEVEAFQSIGVQLRECLLSLMKAVRRTDYVPTDREPPKGADFVHWMELVAEAVAGGGHAQETRGHLKAVSKTTWQLVNWLTHASNAVRHDARLAVSATENVVGIFLNAVEKHESEAPERCPSCGSYRVASDYRPEFGIDPPYILVCERCDWIAPKQIAPERAQAAHRAWDMADRVRESRRPPAQPAVRSQGRASSQPKRPQKAPPAPAARHGKAR